MEYPCRVPLKVIGIAHELKPETIQSLIEEQLGPQAVEENGFTSKKHGAYASYTFWISLPDDRAERILRTKIQQIHGYVMQI